MTENLNYKWYVAHVQSGSEGTVVKALNEKIARQGKEKFFDKILVPTHEVTEVKLGKRVNSEKKFFPGYVLIKMVMNDDTWHMVRSLPRVTGFLGANNKPVAISEKEAEKLLHSIEDHKAGAASLITYEIGDEVKVIEGPFASFIGKVEEVDNEKQRLKVSVSIFGRPTEVELDFLQVEK